MRLHSGIYKRIGIAPKRALPIDYASEFQSMRAFAADKYQFCSYGRHCQSALSEKCFGYYNSTGGNIFVRGHRH
jgi:hypothetical protein